MTITEFLLARIAEDEAGARRGLLCGEAHPTADVYHPDGHPDPRAERECEAKRRIVAEHPLDDEGFCYDDATHSHGCKWHWPCPTLRALASVYADHPDYHEEWRP